MSVLHLTNPSATKNLSIVGDNGSPALSLKSAGTGHNTTTLNVKELLGNVLLCDTLHDLINSSEISVRWSSASGKLFTADEIDAAKNGTLFDANEDSVVDSTPMATTLKISGINLASNASGTEVHAHLQGAATQYFIPKHFYFICKTAAHLAGDVKVNVSTTSTGTELVNAATLTSLDGVGHIFRIDQAVTTVAGIAGNATIFAKCSTADTGSGGTPVGTADLYIEGVLLN